MINEGLYRINKMLMKDSQCGSWNTLNWILLGYARSTQLPHFVTGRCEEMWYQIFWIPQEDKHAIVFNRKIADGVFEHCRVDFIMHNDILEPAPEIGDPNMDFTFKHWAKVKTAALDTIRFIANINAFWTNNFNGVDVRCARVTATEVEDNVKFYLADELQIEHLLEEDGNVELRYVIDIYYDENKNQWFFCSSRNQPTRQQRQMAYREQIPYIESLCDPSRDRVVRHVPTFNT